MRLHTYIYISVVLYLVLHCDIRIQCISILYLFTHLCSQFIVSYSGKESQVVVLQMFFTDRIRDILMISEG